MSNHFTGLSLGPPLGDQRLDLCDLYAFQSPADPSRTVLILNANPTADALHPDAIYRLAIDNDGDLPDGHRVQLRLLEPAGRQADRRRLLGQRRGVRSPEAVGTKIFADAEVSFGAEPNIVTSGDFTFFAGSAQRRVLLRLRRHQEPVRHQRRPQLHRAASRAANRHGRGVDSNTEANVFSTAIELPTSELGADPDDPDLGPLQRAARRQAAARRPRRPPVGQQLLQHRRHQRGVQRQRAGQRPGRAGSTCSST